MREVLGLVQTNSKRLSSRRSRACVGCCVGVLGCGSSSAWVRRAKTMERRWRRQDGEGIRDKDGGGRFGGGIEARVLRLGLGF